MDLIRLPTIRVEKNEKKADKIRRKKLKNTADYYFSKRITI